MVLLGSNAFFPFIARADLVATNLSAVAPYVVEQDRDSRVWRSVELRTNHLGRVTARTNAVTELQTGLYHQVGNEWVESQALIEIDPEGGAKAVHGAHQAWFAPDLALNRPFTCKVTTPGPNGAVIKTKIMGLAFYDFKRQESVLLAEPRETEGLLVGDNQIVYPDAFDGGFRVDVVYTYTRDAVEQDIVIRERIPLPEMFNFDPRSTWLEAWTEVDAPEPVLEKKIRRNWEKSTVDQTIDFGGMKIPQGRAFGLDDMPDKHDGLPVRKHWLTVPGEGNQPARNFLIEEVSFRVAALKMQPLPVSPQAAIRRANPQNIVQRASSSPNVVAASQTPSAALPSVPASRPGASGLVASKTRAVEGHPHLVSKESRLWPARTVATATTAKPMRVAQLDLPKTGFVIDWLLLTSESSKTLAADETYYVSGTVNIDDLVIEGGTVVKYTNGASLNVLNSVTCLTEPYRPAVFTSYKDNSVGQSVAAGIPEGTYATVALSLANEAELQYLHFRHAAIALHSSAFYSIKHSQFIHCGRGLHTEEASFYTGNILMYDVTNAFYGKYFQATNEHITLHEIGTVLDDSVYNPPDCNSHSLTTLVIRNSLVVGYDQWGDAEPTLEYTAAFEEDPGNIFQTVGAAGHYLINNSPYRGATVAAIHPGLTNELSKLTTYPPVVLAQPYFETNTILHPQAPRDIGLNCLGYHYAPLDFCIGGKILSAQTLTLTNGVAVGFYNTDGAMTVGPCAIDIRDGAQIISEGTPLALNQMVWFNTVQEQASTNWSTFTDYESIATWDYLDPTEIRCRFTHFSRLAGGIAHIGLGDVGFEGTVALTHSRLSGGTLYLQARTQPLNVGITNCVFDRCSIYSVAANADLVLYAYNNLFYGGTNSHYVDETNAEGWWTFKDNLFYLNRIEQTVTANHANLTHSHNAYVTNSTTNHRLGTTATGDVMLSSFAFEPGPLSRFYQPTGNSLLDAGSRSAADAGLYHFTVTANQVKDSSNVDIGAHWVAISSNVPADADTDGLADYFEDIDGDGAWDSGVETKWQTSGVGDPADTDGDTVSDYLEWLQGSDPLIDDPVADTTPIIFLKVFTPLK